MGGENNYDIGPMIRWTLPDMAGASDFRAQVYDGVWLQGAAAICARHNLAYATLGRSPLGENIIFFVDDRWVIKIFAPLRDGYLRERAALEFAAGKLDVETPEIVYTGEIEGWSYLVMTRLAGSPAREIWAEMKFHEQVETVSHLGAALNSLHSYGAPLSHSALNRDWHGFIERQATSSIERQRACGANSQWLERLPAYVAERLDLLQRDFRPVLLHGDVHLGNLLLGRESGQWKVRGLCDFADSMCGFPEYDFVAPGVLMMQGDRTLQRAFLLAYGYEESQLDVSLRARLMLLTVLYECSDLRKYALRLRPEAVNFTLDELEAAIWTFAVER